MPPMHASVFHVVQTMSPCLPDPVLVPCLGDHEIPDSRDSRVSRVSRVSRDSRHSSHVEQSPTSIPCVL